MTNKPKILSRNHIGCLNDLRQSLAQVPSDVEGVEEMYQLTVYHDEATDEKWLEIQPAD